MSLAQVLRLSHVPHSVVKSLLPSSAAGPCQLRSLHLSTPCEKKQAGRYKRSPKGDKPLTYEMANPPHYIAHRKSWNSWNTCYGDTFFHSLLDTEAATYVASSATFLYLAFGYDPANVQGGIRPAETLFEDVFIRKFMVGTWHNLFLSEIIIKRQHNMIRIAGIVLRSLPPRKLYFLIGYTEELLSYWLQCPVKLELQTVADKKEVVFKYI